MDKVRESVRECEEEGGELEGMLHCFHTFSELNR